MPDAPPAVGDVLAGKYRVERVLGEGGMGVVVAATHLQLGQTVALKFMRQEARKNPRAAERFLREARSAVRLKSHHVCKILDVGTLEGGAPYIVMEFLEGTDLARLLDRRERLAAAEASDIVVQACDALAEAHALGIIHRDLKPANLFLAKAANGATAVKVLDFGIAKARGELELSMTGTDTVMGSPAYMSPEQLRSAKNVDERTDIWALGVILFEAVTGRVPFDAESYPDLCLRVMLDPTPPLPAEVPAGFTAVVRRCLEKDAARRYASIAELGVALAELGSPASRIAHAATLASTEEPRAKPGRWRTVALSLALSTAAAAVVLSLRRHDESPPPATTAPAPALTTAPPPPSPAARPPDAGTTPAVVLEPPPVAKPPAARPKIARRKAEPSPPQPQPAARDPYSPDD